MLKFLKKKKPAGESPDPVPPQASFAQKGARKGREPEVATEPAGPPPKKKRFTIKRILLFLLVPVLAASGWVGYSWFFAPQNNTGDAAPVYKTRKLAHIRLPEEMLKFTFEKMPDLYAALVDFNTEIIRLDREIARIEAVGQKYPEQRKIVDTEKKIWEKTKSTLSKEFSKIDKPLREAYVLFRVNSEQGLARVEEKSGELTGAAQAALSAAKEQTAKLTGREPPPPEGMIKGTVYKLKKKFL